MFERVGLSVGASNVNDQRVFANRYVLDLEYTIGV